MNKHAADMIVILAILAFFVVCYLASRVVNSPVWSGR